MPSFLLKQMFKKGEKHHQYIDGQCNLKQSKFYRSWRAILQRCNNPNDDGYKHYGGKGIKCLWKSYQEFKKDMYKSFIDHNKKHGGRETSIDRIDVDGHYCKENCRWATQKEQLNNTTKNIKVFYDGKYYTYSQLSNKAKVSRSTFFGRIKNGWSVENALNIPLGRQQPTNKRYDYSFLTPRQQLVLKLRYKGWILQEIADTIGYTKERVRQLQKKAEKTIFDKTG